ncbi:hypothetical protein B0O99DRAFT_73541 [Bisporella sp. PMI_857]|nr:hypothetical protein B0O99DRAFT_73541 [Bisporella sp. PMI_857]
MIEPEWMWLFLPGQIVDYMDILMDIKDIGFNPFKFFDCNKRHTLPDLVLNLGGIEVSISPWAYSARDKDGVEGWASCISLLLDCNDDGIFLGAGFLRGVRMVVDLEKDTIG